MQERPQFGIYLNSIGGEVVRINSPYWIPEEPDWVLLTDEVNATLLDIRTLASEKGLSTDAENIKWGRIPLKD
ncbi:MAG: hypothetical protein VX966_08040 [Chloroflexota bacterium]|nr:hypothetical protein [Chloroflexota bacterium]